MATQAGIAYVTVQYDPSSVGKLRTETKRHGESITRTLGGAGLRAGRALALGIGVGAAATGYGLYKAVTAAGDFQKQLNILQAVSGATAKQMKAISTESIALGKDIHLPATSAQDAAVAMTELTKAGLSVKDAMAAARGSLELATAGQTDVATASSITAAALNQFGLAGNKATHVADLLAGAANASAGDVTDFGASLTYVGGAAHAAGQPIELVVAALAEMANKGIVGSIAGTSLANAFRALQAPTAAASAVLKKFNLDVYDAAGNMKPLNELSAIFTKQLGDQTQKTQNAALATLFGTRSVQAARVVLLGGAKALEKYKEKTDQAGAAQRLTAAQTKGFSGAIAAFRSNIETLGIQIGLVLIPYVTTAVRKLSDLVSLIGRVADAKSPTLAVKLLFTGAKDVVSSIKGFLFGEQQKAPLAVQVHRGDIGGQTEGVVRPLVSNIQKGLLAVDWASIGKKVASSFAAGLVFTTDQASKIVSSLADGINQNKGKIADVSAGIALSMISSLLDPVFWAKNWRTILAIALAVFPISDVVGIGGKIGVAITRPIGRVLARFMPDAFKASFTVARGIVVNIAKRIGLEIALLIDRGLTKTRGFAEDVFSAIYHNGVAFIRSLVGRWSALFKSVFNDVAQGGEQAFSRVGRSILRAAGKMVTFLAKVGVIKAAIDGIAAAFQYVIDKIKEAIGYLSSLAGKASSISGIIGGLTSAAGRVKGLLSPHTGGVVTTGGLRLAGGGVALGGIPNRDSIPALLTPGEMVLNGNQQVELFRLLNNGGGVGGVDVHVYVGNEPVDARVEVAMKKTSRRVRAGSKWGN